MGRGGPPAAGPAPPPASHLPKRPAREPLLLSVNMCRCYPQTLGLHPAHSSDREPNPQPRNPAPSDRLRALRTRDQRPAVTLYPSTLLSMVPRRSALLFSPPPPGALSILHARSMAGDLLSQPSPLCARRLFALGSS